MTNPAGLAGEPVIVVAAGSGSLMEDVIRVLSHSRWTLLRVLTVRETRTILPGIGRAVLMCEAALADGTWRDMLECAAALPRPLPVIVVSGQADDRFWMEVLNAGGYNVIGRPLEELELIRVVSAAWLRQDNAACAGAAWP